jgi:hypothetical protein
LTPVLTTDCAGNILFFLFVFQARRGEDKSFSNSAIPGFQPRVPQQPNYSDCGLYAMQYLESFFLNPVKQFSFPIPNSALGSWFPEAQMEGKRRQVYETILNLVKTNYPGSRGNVPRLKFPSN